MLNYNAFKQVVADHIKDYLPDEYQDSIIKLESVNKINETLDALVILSNEINDELKATPTIYLNGVYEDYKKDHSLERILSNIASVWLTFVKDAPKKLPQIDYECAKNNIIVQVINTSENTELLKDLPHRNFLDLSVIYRWIIDWRSDNFASTLVSHGLADKLGMSEQILFELAMENTKRLMPIQTFSLIATCKDLFDFDEHTDFENDPFGMYILTNPMKSWGANAFLFKENFKELADRLNSDLYLIPSSTEELLATSTEGKDPMEIAELVCMVNANDVITSEILSNNVYHYDRKLDEITIANITPDKHLS